MTKDLSPRRQFLKNAALGTIGLAALGTAKASSPAATPEDDLQGDCEPTTLDAYGEGPFYTENPPLLAEGMLADEDEVGTRMIISGRVRDFGCTEILPDTIIDVWHANDAGDYDNQGYNLRGKLMSNEQGFYLFETIYPGKYLNGAAFRPAHIHFKITPPGFPTLTTQLYFEGDPDLDTDFASSITSGQFDATQRRIVLLENDQGVLEGTWDIVIDGDGVPLGVGDLHLERGMIYSAGPNPYSSEITIRYGVFNEAAVSLAVYDMKGKEVAVLDERRLTPEKYEAVWQPDSSLPSGHYFIVLKLNDLQVHHLKVVRE